MSMAVKAMFGDVCGLHGSSYLLARAVAALAADVLSPGRVCSDARGLGRVGREIPRCSARVLPFTNHQVSKQKESSSVNLLAFGEG